jgi:hypothetical protein
MKGSKPPDLQIRNTKGNQRPPIHRLCITIFASSVLKNSNTPLSTRLKPSLNTNSVCSVIVIAQNALTKISSGLMPSTGLMFFHFSRIALRSFIANSRSIMAEEVDGSPGEAVSACWREVMA